MKMLRVCIYMLLMSLIIVACSNSMHYEAAAKKGYVVYVQGEIINYTYFEQFVENYNNGQDATVKIAKYTDEGDPIFHTLEYKRDQKKSVIPMTTARMKMEINCRQILCAAVSQMSMVSIT